MTFFHPIYHFHKNQKKKKTPKKTPQKQKKNKKQTQKKKNNQEVTHYTRYVSKLTFFVSLP